MTDLPPQEREVPELTRREAAIKSNGYNEGWCEAEAQFRDKLSAAQRVYGRAETELRDRAETAEAKVAEKRELLDAERRHREREASELAGELDDARRRLHQATEHLTLALVREDWAKVRSALAALAGEDDQPEPGGVCSAHGNYTGTTCPTCYRESVRF